MEFSYTKVLSHAPAPLRSHSTDSGFDLSLLEVSHTIGDVSFYRTGISVRPPPGFYFDLVPRSSLSKTGYMLAHGIGIIDMDYTGEILVPLRKVNHEAPDLELPIRLVQLIPRTWHAMTPVEKELPSTTRGEGAFGSTT